MSSNPTTFHGEPGDRKPVDWDDSSELHLHEDNGGVLHRFKTIRRGTLAELIDVVMDLPEDEQPRYSIQKAGDHRLEIGEIRALFSRPDFPGNKG
ncbi:hypothetical protein GCM10011371_02470 [Novosphingobium marinum]|uniref:Uncharacterized protein n=1 Tax=Novosphingobium marinum TaxID=1514948 RepID=A0A7Y9XVC4_9SPHN|nr:hypothetical protein [Novosphingobium marinum]NYH93938.1 hypothetical protein [Novosphingobium marinum]GGC18419.1 hypothetical protein GCM10011371_02470 [Novosphingobium marinum]